MNMQSDSGLLQARELLKKGDALSAKQKLEEALSDDLENSDIIYTLRCANYWAERLANIVSLPTPFERGEALVEQWKHFSGFIGAGCEQSLYAVRCGIFNLALENYSALLNDSSSGFATRSSATMTPRSNFLTMPMPVYRSRHQ